jgi:TolA-binding protein
MEKSKSYSERMEERNKIILKINELKDEVKKLNEKIKELNEKIKEYLKEKKKTKKEKEEKEKEIKELESEYIKKGIPVPETEKGEEVKGYEILNGIIGMKQILI